MKIRKFFAQNWAPILAIAALAAIFVLRCSVQALRDAMWDNYSYYVFRSLRCAMLGTVMLCVLPLLSEAWLRKGAKKAYMGGVVLLLLQLVWGYFAYPGPFGLRFLRLGGISVCTAELMPLLWLWPACLLGGEKKLTGKQFAGVCALLLLPVLPVALQDNPHPAVIALAVAVVTVLLLRQKGRISVPWGFLWAAVGLLLTLCVVLCCLRQDGAAMKTMLTRGAWDPFDSGWVRRNLDMLMAATPFLGGTEMRPAGYDAAQFLLRLWDHDGAVLLVKGGWLAFLGFAMLYLLLFAGIFGMVRGLRDLGRNAAFLLAAGLLLRTVYSFAGLFLLPGSPCDPAFFRPGTTATVMDLLSFAMIFALFVRQKRQKNSHAV